MNVRLNYNSKAWLLFASLSLAWVVHGPALGAPANDNFANRTTLTGSNILTTGTNNLATKEGGEAVTVAGELGGASIWYTWTAPADGTVVVHTQGSSFDTILGVYTAKANKSGTAK